MQLYNTKVIPSATDALWIPPPLPDMAAARLLVITQPFAAGSMEEQTLSKMLGACRLSSSDYAVLQMAGDQFCSWSTIAGSVGPKSVLLLGITPTQLSIHALFRLHSLNAFLDRTFIPALSLTQIESNPAAKKELWSNGLKPLFGL